MPCPCGRRGEHRVTPRKPEWRRLTDGVAGLPPVNTEGAEGGGFPRVTI